MPNYLADAIHDLAEPQRGKTAAASAELTLRYKAGTFAAPAVRAQSDRSAYLTTRLPATFAAAARIFQELHRRAPEGGISSLLDLGAGPGTALFAAAEVFSELRTATLIEGDAQWLHLGRHLASGSPLAPVREAQWVQHDLQSPGELPAHDVVVLSYVLGELATAAQSKLLMLAWRAARQFLVVIEPGTRRGFANVHDARSAMITAGGEILAPCPHKNVCPMAAADDWCHFAQRLERTAEHRRAKGGSLGYEDEKLSYIIGSRQVFLPAAARIVRHPQKHSGHVQFQLCTREGLVRTTVTRSQKEAYRRARQAEWGDEWSS